MRLIAVVPLLLALGSCAPRKDTLQSWVADPHHRVYRGSFGRNVNQRDIKLQAARNEYAIFQVAARGSQDLPGLTTDVTDLSGPGGSIPASRIRVRYPGYLPVDENGQYTPDPLYTSSSVDLQANLAQPIWIDLLVPEKAAAGIYHGAISLRQRGATLASFNVELEVLDFTLPPVTRDHFYLNILFDPGSVARVHHVPRWSEEHWQLLREYIRNWAGHSQDAITVFFIEDPWEGDTGFPVAASVDWRLPGAWDQLRDPQFEFDYANFDRFVQLCLDAGINKNLQAWSPVNMPHLDYAVISYFDTRSNENRKLKVVAGAPGYERVWSQFAKSFQDHLKAKGWLGITTVGLDEISSDNLDRIVPIFRKVAPDLWLMVSGGDEKGKYQEFSPETAFHFGYIRSDVPMPDTAVRRKQGKRTLLYTANTPLRPNTFLFSEPLESRMLPWIVWKYDFDGYIRWAWNFWFDGYMEQPFYKWHSGDMFFVYPGKNGPIDSIRVEMLRKGAQDYEVLWMIRERLQQLSDRTKVEAVQKKIGEAMELATQENDPVRPHRPMPSDIAAARGQLNHILLDLMKSN